MSKKKKILVLSGMVALLVLTGCLNYFLNRPSDAPAGADGSLSYTDYFASSRADRESSRSETVMYYNAIISSESSSAEAKSNAEAGLAALVSGMDTEQRLETLVKSIGFDDCIVTVGTENITVLVKSDALTEQEVAQVLDLVITETGKTLEYIRVKPVEV